MELSELFWNATVEELKQGFKEDTDAFVCLLCGEKVEKGIIYRHGDQLVEASRYIHVHIREAHKSVFDYLINLNKKLTGLTEHQNNLLRLFYEGKSDSEIQKELNIGSASTIRHHRFTLKEKERQAKTFLAMMELLKEKDQHAPTFVPVHKTATMIDDRYNITEDEQEKIIKKYFLKGALRSFPTREKEKIVILREITKLMNSNQTYTEKELNEVLKKVYDDFALIRRYLIQYGFLDRKNDGSAYWLKK